MVRYALDFETLEVVEGRLSKKEVGARRGEREDQAIIRYLVKLGYTCFGLFRSKTYAINFALRQPIEEPTSIYCPRPDFDDDDFLEELNKLKRVRYYHMEMLVAVNGQVMIFDPFIKENDVRLPRRFPSLYKVRSHQRRVFEYYWRLVPKDSVEFIELLKFGYVALKQKTQYHASWFCDRKRIDERIRLWQAWYDSGKEEVWKPATLDYSKIKRHLEQKRRRSYVKSWKDFSLSISVF
jgi:hypothetical protein